MRKGVLVNTALPQRKLENTAQTGAHSSEKSQYSVPLVGANISGDLTWLCFPNENDVETPPAYRDRRAR